MTSEPPTMGRVQQGALWLTRTGPFRKLIGPKVLGKADRWVMLQTKGRLTAFGPPMFPTMVLTTKGRKSGEPRSVSLVYVPDGDDAYVVGSNWARDGHPAWSHNLLADPHCTVTAGGEQWHARARLLSDGEKAAAWPDLIEVMPQWDQYVELTDRNIRVLHLERVT